MSEIKSSEAIHRGQIVNEHLQAAPKFNPEMKCMQPEPMGNASGIAIEQMPASKRLDAIADDIALLRENITLDQAIIEAIGEVNVVIEPVNQLSMYLEREAFLKRAVELEKERRERDAALQAPKVARGQLEASNKSWYSRKPA